MSDGERQKSIFEPIEDPRFAHRAHELIPGGCHTYAKGDDQFPVNAPRYLTHGHGCRVYDDAQREFIEYGMGLRSVTLGHAFSEVVEAAYRQMQLGSNFGRIAPVELECATQLLGMVPRADMVKFAKDGSTVTTAALKLARAYTGRKLIAICADHPFFSYDDWFIGTTGIDAGVDSAAVAHTLRFRYNDADSLTQLFTTYPEQIACVMLEAARIEEPRPDFLPAIRRLCDEHGALLVLDEMVTGFRWSNGGAQAVYDIEPDLSCFGKALGNGFAISALAGKRRVMELGGLRHKGERVFLLSTTHGAEYHALAAAIATMRIYQREPVIERLYRAGDRLRMGIDRSIDAYGVRDYFRLVGRSCAIYFATLDQDRQPSQAFRTLFMQEMIRGGVIAPSFIVSYSHDDAAIDRTIEVVDAALRVFARALEGGVERYLVGPAVKPVYRKFN